jgi:hypothetical protein
MSKSIIIDPELDSYRTFFDHAWAREIHAAAEDTALESAVFDLCVAWRGAANTHCLPWVMVQNMKAFADGLTRAYVPVGKRMADEVSAWLVAKMGDDLRHMQRKRLSQVVQELAGQANAAASAAQYEVDGPKYFHEIAGNAEFQFCLSGSQRLCYGALYQGYEHLLLRVYKAVTGTARYRIRPGTFAGDFAAALGTALRDYCWSDAAVNVARVTRHALAHAGGRVTDDLRKLNHGLRVEGDEIHILPSDTRALHELLKDRAKKLIVEAVPKLPAGPK